MLTSRNFCCPVCKSELIVQPETWTCSSCGRSFPVIFGIPDLRIFPDPYVDFETDREKALHLANHFDELSFEEMVRFYYLTTAAVPQHHARQYTWSLLTAEARAEEGMHNWERRMLMNREAGPFLEVGCGTAPLLIAAAKRFDEVIGVDIALRWLVVGKKRLQRAGITVPLICACAEALPLHRSSFGTAVFDSTLEVVSDQKGSLMEIRRVLKEDGSLVITTPNRYSFGPDPHMKVWFGGYLPERWLAAYARRQKAIPPKRRLFSARSLSRLLRESGFVSVQVTVAPILKEQTNRLPRIFQIAVSLYNISKNWIFFGWLFRTIGPLLEAVARKPAGEGEAG